MAIKRQPGNLPKGLVPTRTAEMAALRKNPQFMWLLNEVAATQKAVAMLLQVEADRVDDVGVKRRLLDAIKELRAESALPRRPKP
jgi:hypothetical protein